MWSIRDEVLFQADVEDYTTICRWAAQLACPHFPHKNNIQLAIAVEVGKWETPRAFSKQTKPASFPPLILAASSAGVM